VTPEDQEQAAGRIVLAAVVLVLCAIAWVGTR